jgi:hypothetical protein
VKKGEKERERESQRERESGRRVLERAEREGVRSE